MDATNDEPAELHRRDALQLLGLLVLAACGSGGGGASATGDLIGGPVAPLHLDLNVDTYIYDDNGDFDIRLATSAGEATISKGDRPGAFNLRIVDIPNHPELTSFEAHGVANRITEIPMTFTVTRTDGGSTTGSCTFIPQR